MVTILSHLNGRERGANGTLKVWKCFAAVDAGLHGGEYIILPGDKENANKSFFPASHGLELKTE